MLSAIAHIDYAVFAVTSVVALVAISVSMRRFNRKTIMVWALMSALLVVGWFLVEAAGDRERARLRKQIEGFAPTYANELAAMGHAKITVDTPPDDPLYRAMIDKQIRWLDLTPAVADIYTFRKLSNSFSYVMNHDYFFQEGSQAFGIEQAEAYGVAQYLTYDHNDHLAAGIRLEIYRDDDGFAGAGFRSGNEAAAAVYTNLTMGLQLRPRSGFVVRPEIRWDWQDRDSITDTPAFNAGTSDDQFLFSTDAVISF